MPCYILWFWTACTRQTSFLQDFKGLWGSEEWAYTEETEIRWPSLSCQLCQQEYILLQNRICPSSIFFKIDFISLFPLNFNLVHHYSKGELIECCYYLLCMDMVIRFGRGLGFWAENKRKIRIFFSYPVWILITQSIAVLQHYMFFEIIFKVEGLLEGWYKKSCSVSVTLILKKCNFYFFK